VTLDEKTAAIQMLSLRLDTLAGEWRGTQRRWRKEDRPRLARAKRAAQGLRWFLRRVADFHTDVSRALVDEWVAKYLAFCSLLRVAAPVVKVPRSLRRHLGATIPRPAKLGWEALADEALAIPVMWHELRAFGNGESARALEGSK
jgi:hypothetical protein